MWFEPIPNANFYPRPPRGGRRDRRSQRRHRDPISIHALREEDDISRSGNELHPTQFLSTPSARRTTNRAEPYARHKNISIHALREEDDKVEESTRWADLKFLSTPSARRTTVSGRLISRAIHHFYPRPPRGGRRSVCSGRVRPLLFLSTPSARRTTEADIEALEAALFLSTPSARRTTVIFAPKVSALPEFLSTPSARRTTLQDRRLQLGKAISIHALREEDDFQRMSKTRTDIKFLSTPSARRTTHTRRGDRWAWEFLSTPSARRTTRFRLDVVQELDISIHALREEDDSKNRDKISIFKQIIQHSARI